MIARFNGNVVPFADDSTSTNRTVFGGVTQSDAIDDNLNADFKKGWEIVGLNDNPTREDFNAMGYTLGALTAYLYEMGISEWNASQNYRANSRVTGSDGKIYKSLTGTTGTPNVGNNPTSDAVNWQLEIITNYSTLTAKTTPVDNDLIALGDSTSLFSLKKLTWANIKATLETYFDTLYKVASSETTSGIIELATTAEAQAGTDDLRAITPLKLKNSVLGLGQTWQDVTVSRVNGITYTNSTGKPIEVMVVLSADYPQLYVNGLQIAQVSSGVRNVFFIVPNSQTYKVTFGTGSIASWSELR